MARTIVRLVTTSLIAVGLAAPATALEIYENLESWMAAAPEAGAEVTIDFDEIRGPVEGDEYSAMPGGPVFSLIEGDQIVFDDVLDDQVDPSSGRNFLSPDHLFSEGIIRVEFSEPVVALGANFFDVENDFALTGFSTVLGAAAPNVSFSSFQGQGSQSFLGFVPDAPISAVDIYFATGEDIDGTVLDDLRYVVVPEPTTAALAALGLVGLGMRARARRSHA